MSASDETNTSNFPRRDAGGSPLQMLLNFFSSVWLGVWLLSILFIYCTIGSIGVWLPGSLYGLSQRHDWIHDIYWFIPWTQLHVRQAPGMEMTEFEWFHWWPFYLNILLICINLVVATIRRIPLNVLNLGVWMIHTGIIILAIGSVVYFGTKLEGDAPILRRQLVIQVPGYEPISIAAQPGQQYSIEGESQSYLFRVMNVDPEWEMLTGDAAGEKTYAVMVEVLTPEQHFVRTLPVGYPEHVQDAIFTDEPGQPLVRAINAIGRPIVDDSINLSLVYSPQHEFFLMESAAIYLREKGSAQWVQRPIADLPRYNDYIRSTSEVWAGPDQQLPTRELHIPVPAVDPSRDPLGEAPLTVRSYINYGLLETHRVPGGNRIDPAVRVRLQSERGQVQDYELVASDPSRNTVESGRLAFRWAQTNEDISRIATVRSSVLEISMHEADVHVEAPVRISEDDAFIPIGETGYAYRVESVEHNLHIGPGEPMSVALVQIRSPQRTFQRWVFDHPDMPNRDLSLDSGSMHEQELELDSAISMRYRPGRRPAPVTIIAGPAEDQLTLLLHIGTDEPTLQPLRAGQSIDLQAGISMQVIAYAPRTVPETRPRVVPPQSRERNARQQRSLIRVALPGHEQASVWLPYHHFPFSDPTQVMRRFLYSPTEVTLPDGRVIELMYSRQRRPLPTQIALHDFQVAAHIGGFTGQTSSIRDWTSIVRFDRDGFWTEPEPISMNKPANYGGFWYFQAQWDPPDGPRFEGDAPSAGLNYTVLGVGNRNGVWTQLFGCVVSVAGMIYAFWIKPAIKRRRQQAVYARVHADGGDGQLPKQFLAKEGS